MERSEILAAMAELKLYGMKSAYDEIIVTAVKRQHEPQRIVGDLLTAEISEKQARSIKYQITISKLPIAKDLEDFAFDDAPVNETLVRDLAGGDFLDHQRNVVLIGGTGCQCRANFPHLCRSKIPQIGRSRHAGEVTIFGRPAAWPRRRRRSWRCDGGLRAKMLGHEFGVLTEAVA